MKISVVVPVYNVSCYIERCLQSVVKQKCDAEIECILVDDCGTDDSVELCEKFISQYQGPIQFKIEHHEKNGGLSAARNTGTKVATGDYVYYLDSDDEIAECGLENLLKTLRKYPESEMVQGGIKSIPYSAYYDFESVLDREYADDNVWVRKHFYSIGKRINGCAWNKLIRMDFLLRNNLFFMEGIIHEDMQWMFHVVKYLKKIAFVKEDTYIHYSTPNSIISSSSKEKSDRNWTIILKDVNEHLDTPCYWEQLMEYSYLSLVHNAWKFENGQRLIKSYASKVRKVDFFKGCCFYLASKILPYASNDRVKKKIFHQLLKVMALHG